MLSFSKLQEPVKGKIRYATELMSYKSEIQAVQGDWVVTQDGDLLNVNNLYDIPHERLTEPFWISHIEKKQWCNFGDFMRAYMYALSLNGIESLTFYTNTL